MAPLVGAAVEAQLQACRGGDARDDSQGQAFLFQDLALFDMQLQVGRQGPRIAARFDFVGPEAAALENFVHAVAVFVVVLEKVFLGQEPPHEFATCRGAAEAAGFFAHKEDDLQGPFVDEAVFPHAAGDFDGGEDAADAVVVAAFGDAVRVRPTQEGWQVFPRAPAVADDVAEGVGTDFQAGFFHEGQKIAPPFPVRCREGDAVDAFRPVGVGRDGRHLVQLFL